MIEPLLGIALRELPPTVLPLTVSVPAMLASHPTVMLLVDDKLEAVKAPVDASPPPARLPVDERVEADKAPVQARLPTVRAPDTPQFPTMVAPEDVREPVVTCVACSWSTTKPFVTSRPKHVVTGLLREMAVVATLSSKVATFGSMEEPPPTLSPLTTSEPFLLSSGSVGFMNICVTIPPVPKMFLITLVLESYVRAPSLRLAEGLAANVAKSVCNFE